MVREPDHQWNSGRFQQPHSIRQGQGSGLPHAQELYQHGLPDAYQFRLTFQDIFTIKNRHQGATLLKAWLENARTSDLPPIVRVAYTIMNHWDGVLRWFESQITN
ncbi:transposase (plasmid) [Acidithiobacillus caldus]|nr:transposase [Acidithiobacillus caldus]